MKPSPWILVLLLAVSASAGAAWYLAAPEPDMELRAGDRFAYNVTRDTSTRTYVAEVLGEVAFVNDQGALETAMAIEWVRDKLVVLAHYRDGEVLRLSESRQEDGEDVNINPYVPYDETYTFHARHEEVRFPQAAACPFAQGELDCTFAPFGYSLGRDGNVTIEPHDLLPLAASFTWPDATAELVGFERGEPRAVAPETPLPALSKVPVGAVLPADLDMDFPLQDAVDHAMSSPDYLYFHEWLETHPDHYIARADYWMYSTDVVYGPVEEDRSWDLTWTDGVEEYDVRVMQRSLETADLGLPLVVSGEPGVIPPRGGYETRYPERADAPPMTPWSELMAAAEARIMSEVHGLPIEDLRMELRCNDDCSEHHWRFQVQTFRDERSLNPTVNTLVIPDSARAAMEFRFDGNRLRHAEGFVDEEAVASSIGEPTPVPAAPPERESEPVAMAVPAAGVGAFGLALLVKILLPLFSRVRPDHLSQHPLRRRIMDLVEADPGIHLGELERRLDVPTSTMKHHVRKLIEGDRVQARRLGRYQCLFPAGPLRAEAVAEAEVVRSDGAQQILRALRRRPGQGVRDLAATTGLNASTVSYHARRLEQAGSVIAQRDGRVKRLRLA